MCLAILKQLLICTEALLFALSIWHQITPDSWQLSLLWAYKPVFLRPRFWGGEHDSAESVGSLQLAYLLLQGLHECHLMPGHQSASLAPCSVQKELTELSTNPVTSNEISCGYWPKEPPIPWVYWFWTLICWPTIPTPKTGFFWFFIVVFSNLFSLDWIASAFFFSYLLDLLIYLWLCWVFVAACGLSLDAESGGCSLLWCPGFSLRRLLFLPSRGSRQASVVVVHRPSICHTACEIFQEQRSNSCPLHWQVGS